MALALAMRHPRTPWQAKAVGSLTLLYALSPVDLIPDFIPVVGHLDDLLIVPLGIWLTAFLVPRDIWLQCQEEAATPAALAARKGRRGMVPVIAFWVGMAAVLGWLLLR